MNCKPNEADCMYCMEIRGCEHYKQSKLRGVRGKDPQVVEGYDKRR